MGGAARTCAPERVGAAFHYVRQNETVLLQDLLDGRGLAALVEALPVAGDRG